MAERDGLRCTARATPHRADICATSRPLFIPRGSPVLRRRLAPGSNRTLSRCGFKSCGEFAFVRFFPSFRAIFSFSDAILSKIFHVDVQSFLMNALLHFQRLEKVFFAIHTPFRAPEIIFHQPSGFK
jgi:hypothetical protein